jgi:hypothetical protein
MLYARVYLILSLLFLDFASAEVGSLLVTDMKSSFMGTGFFLTDTMHLIHLKPPPTEGIIRVIGEKGVVLPSQQFSFDIETSLFGWKKTKVYQVLLPLELERFSDMTIYKAVTASPKTGIQDATIYLLDKKKFNLPMRVTCKNKKTSSVGAMSCTQVKGSSFTITIENDTSVTMRYAIAHGEAITAVTISPKATATVTDTISDDFILISSEDDTKNGIVLTIPESVGAELPKPEGHESSTDVQIGVGVSFIQCGSKSYTKTEATILTITKNCHNQHIYQWSSDGRFLWTPPESM